MSTSQYMRKKDKFLNIAENVLQQVCLCGLAFADLESGIETPPSKIAQTNFLLRIYFLW